MNDRPTVLADKPRHDGESGSTSRWSPSLAQARFLVFATALLSSTSGFFVKSPYLAGWSAPRLAFWRAAIAVLVLWPFVRNRCWSWKLLPMTVLFAGMSFTFLTAMVLGTAANAIWLQSIAPVWVLLIGVFMFGERAIARDWLMVAFAALGVGVIIYFESRSVAAPAIVWALASSFFYAGVVLSLRYLRNYDPVWLAAVNQLMTAAVLAPLALADLELPSGKQWLFLGGLGVLQVALPYVLLAYSLKRIAGHEVTAIGLLEPILVPTWAYLAWGDRASTPTIIGAVLILIGLALRYVPNWGRNEPNYSAEFNSLIE